MKKKTLALTYTLTIYAIVIVSMLSSCDSRTKEEKSYEYVTSIEVVDVKGDTVVISTAGGGQMCHMRLKNP